MDAATLCLQGYKAQSTGSMGSRRHVFELMPPEQGMKFFYFMAETETEKKRLDKYLTRIDQVFIYRLYLLQMVGIFGIFHGQMAQAILIIFEKFLISSNESSKYFQIKYLWCKKIKLKVHSKYSLAWKTQKEIYNQFL